MSDECSVEATTSAEAPAPTEVTSSEGSDEPAAKRIKVQEEDTADVSEDKTEDKSDDNAVDKSGDKAVDSATADVKSDKSSTSTAAEGGEPSENGAVEEKEEEDDAKYEETKEQNGEEEKENDNEKVKNDTKENGDKAEADPNKRKSAAEKCQECDYKCWTDAEMRIHCQTSHVGQRSRKLMCSNCSFTCTNTWEMDYHARSRGHKAKEVFTCKKCDVLCDSKEDLHLHRKVHIPEDKLVECADCNWVGDRLDNMRYHIYSQDHKPKLDYEEKARARAEAGGPKALKHYQTKLARDIKKAQGQKK